MEAKKDLFALQCCPKRCLSQFSAQHKAQLLQERGRIMGMAPHVAYIARHRLISTQVTALFAGRPWHC
ncbi:hypothetical protein KIPB_007121 [Kipferlia bialata]|uniref:Uncharacterized protein n=1 Tax=Kipferlia bialata TaxID=797122 RepID=A0A9K3GIT9_9EUKA|nr:hypothetical protein KIPB_007121 [Kipferlia bialata]|eukprot:g7121.t1